jgi:hypothetical protein
MTEGWKARHPFIIGQVVYARAGGELAPMTAVTIHMRGEDDQGCWFGSRDHPRRRFACADFTGAMPPGPGVSVGAAGADS